MEQKKDFERYLKMNREHTRDPFWLQCYDEMERHFDSNDPDVSLMIITLEFRNFSAYWNMRIKNRESFRESERLRAKKNEKLKKAIKEAEYISSARKIVLMARI